jgi:hypothetical protein
VWAIPISRQRLDSVNSRQEVGDRCLLGDVARSTGRQSRADEGWIIIFTQDQDACVWTLLPELLDSFNAASVRYANTRDDQVWLRRANQGQSRRAILGLANHFYIWLSIDEHAQADPYHCSIIENENAYR